MGLLSALDDAGYKLYRLGATSFAGADVLAIPAITLQELRAGTEQHVDVIAKKIKYREKRS